MRSTLNLPNEGVIGEDTVTHLSVVQKFANIVNIDLSVHWRAHVVGDILGCKRPRVGSQRLPFTVKGKCEGVWVVG